MLPYDSTRANKLAVSRHHTFRQKLANNSNEYTDLKSDIEPLPEPMLAIHQWNLVAISQEMLKIFIHDMSLKIDNLEF